MYGDFRSVPAEHIDHKDDRDKPNAKLEDPENDRGRLESLKVIDSQCLGSGKKVGPASKCLTISLRKDVVGHHGEMLIRHPKVNCGLD
ncbi:hypothetical protein chiPu_0007304 [Chiloscyllium punctatum]|uniref:Uncharacterized protein n=1 Tax=Chiloscyllium punctatum TaxID=137246 RepID=A0A401SEW2_CHIPU|nr:hypothetical protein [Chiloscyllium punctatum]